MRDHSMIRESHPVSTLDIPALVASLRERRPELSHYVGAAHRDLVAWHLCSAYLTDRAAPERVLKSSALRVAWGWDVSPDQLPAAA